MPDVRRTLLSIAFIVLLGAVVLAGLSRRPPVAHDVLTLRGPTMGTRWSVQVTPRPAPAITQRLEEDIAATLARINALMSTWDPESEISRFNRGSGTDWFPVSEETYRVLSEARSVGERSGGAFDVTVGPLVDLWGFGPQEARSLPDAALLAATRARVGPDRLALRDAPPALRRTREGVEVDLSAIAKGYAVDAVAEVVAAAGFEDFLVEIGGELRAFGRRAPARPWQVAVERPDGSRAPQQVVRLEDQAIATSGDYRNVVVLDGQRFSHTIDPRTGRPVPPGLASVSVLDASAMRADALATALMAMGPGEAEGWAREQDIDALFLFRDGTGFRESVTPGFEAALVRAE